MSGCQGHQQKPRVKYLSIPLYLQITCYHSLDEWFLGVTYNVNDILSKDSWYYPSAVIHKHLKLTLSFKFPIIIHQMGGQ